MRSLLERMRVMEVEMDEAQSQSDYWLEPEHFDLEKSERFGLEADAIYDGLYQLFDQAAERMVGITFGQIDKVMAMVMIRCRRSEVEKIFAKEDAV